jgi:hypothetical protein
MVSDGAGGAAGQDEAARYIEITLDEGGNLLDLLMGSSQASFK